MTSTAPLAFAAVALPGSQSIDITMEVPAHTTTVVIGDEASGVDALGSYAMGLVAPSHGQALVYGEAIAEMARPAALAFRRRVGYLPAGEGLLHNLSLGENVALPLRFGSELSDRETEARLDLMLSMFSIRHAAALRPTQASDEERRRAALARALAFDPRLAILEHPFDGVTPRVAGQLLELARGGITAEGSRRTVFIVGPDLPEVLRPRVEHRYRIAEGRLHPEE